MTGPLLLNASDLAALDARRNPAHRGRACHAAEKGLFFGLRGKVYSCCFNKIHLLGIYPRDSIDQIWHGQALAQQRQALDLGDMSLGCGGCFDLVKARNLAAAPIRLYDRVADGRRGMPAKMDFELVNTCNLECIMCRGEFSSLIRKNREQLPPIDSPYDAAFFDQLEPYIPHLRHSTFLGGEPLLVPQYQDLWDRMAELNPQMTIGLQTNGTVLSRRIKALLERIDFEISVSIDSLDPVTYGAIRKNGNLPQVLRNLGHFRDYAKLRNRRVGVVMCPMQQNWREMPHFVEFCNEHGLILNFTKVESPAHCSLLSLPAAALQQIVAELSAFSPAQGTELEAANRRTYLDQLAQIQKWQAAADRREKAGIGHQPRDFEEFMEHVGANLRAAGRHGAPECEALQREIEGKLRYVLDRAGERGLRAVAEQRMILIQPDLVIRSVQSLSAEELLPLFSAYVMPLE